MIAQAESFERLFDSILASPALPPAAQEGRRRRCPPPPELEFRIRRAIGLFHQGEFQRCTERLGQLRDEAPGDPRVDAFLAASRALWDGNLVPGLQACVVALRRGEHVPDLCCALGSLLLQAGDRAKAHAAFRKGLAADPVHPHLRVKLRSMGVRQRPPLSSLPRASAVNRLLGLLRARLTAAERRRRN